MSKCIGCGSILQDKDKDGLGYTPKLNNTYCMRCFRLKNYGEVKEDELVDEDKIINKVNNKKGIAFFLIDYLNINKYTLDIYNKITLKKVLVISKIDVLRKDMKFNKITKWLKDIYNIHDDIIYISTNNNYGINSIFNYLDKYNYKSCYIMGITNAGKSTLINKILKDNLIKKEIVTSSKPNTTLDFIKLHINDYIIYDTPGFSYGSLTKDIIKSEIKPITYNIKKETLIIINDEIKLYFDEPNSITLYGVYKNIKRIYKNDIKNGQILDIKDNIDLVLEGIGFINIKQACKVLSNIKINETRPSITGDFYE